AQQGLPQFRPLPGGGTELVDVGTSEPAPAEMTPGPMEQTEESPLSKVILAVLVAIAVLTLLFFGARLLVRYLRGLWRDRPLERREAAAVDAMSVVIAGTDAEPDAAIIRRGIDEALRTIDVDPAPGDSIVAAWVGLEESATDAGAGRAPHE